MKDLDSAEKAIPEKKQITIDPEGDDFEQLFEAINI
jgi:hypothetical protein